MNRSLVCTYCGLQVKLEAPSDLIQLRAHLRRLHTERVKPQDVSRWAQILEHFSVVPVWYVPLPEIMRLEG
jgi:hypothetical protein